MRRKKNIGKGAKNKVVRLITDMNKGWPVHRHQLHCGINKTSNNSYARVTSREG